MAISPVVLEWLLGTIYVVASAGAWVIFGLGLIKGRQRMSLLNRPLPALPSPPPRVSLLIPAKDEVARIDQCLTSALEQDYPNLQVIAIDDRSVDGTSAAMDAVAVRDPRLKVLHITGALPPEGWVGKTHALHNGVRQADGDWFCFVDSDVVLKPDAVRAAVATAEQREFDMISLLPLMESGSFWEGLVVPLAGGAVGAMYMLPLTNYNEVPSIAFANGQFLCIRRSVYEQIGGHEAVRDRFCEDVEIARILKRRGLRPRLALGNDYAAVRMYSSFKAIIRGWARNFYAGSLGSPWRVLGGMAFLVFCCASIVPAIAWGFWRQAHPVIALGGIGWLAAAALHLLLMIAMLAVLYQGSGNRRRYALFFPLGMAMLAAIFCRALWMCITRRVEWRGTQYSHRMDPILTRG